MHARFGAFASTAIVVLACSVSACEDSGTALQSGPTPRTGYQNVLVSVAPAAVAPEFLAAAGCGALPPFRTSFNLFMRSDREVSLRRFGFELRDLSGGRALPVPTLTSLSSAGQASLPVPVPASLPVPIPGTLPFHGVVMSAPLTARFALHFDCGVPPRGRLFIDVETSDRDGVAAVSQVAVDVSS